ncbi:MAG: 30S ribosomal protein S12 methylthiotransferase RimO [Phycisphaerales bacterium]|nr:30S ribosomal protein S12 methylthiotransferase RimO [Phycisphaerales bacterium]
MTRNSSIAVPEPTVGDSDEVQTVSFVSLGCPKNLVDSEKMLGLLAQDGLAIVSHDPESGEDPADAIVINTCGFLEASKDESLGVIKEAIAQKEAGKIKRVVVAGCLVQRHRAKMLEWAPGIDALIGVFDRDHIVEAVRGARRERAELVDGDADDKPRYWVAANALQAAKLRGRETTGLTVNGKDGKGIGYFEDDSARLRLTPRHYAYLRVSEGCNQNCAFCTIPSIRGKMRSKPLDAIKAEAMELIRDGAFELSLIGQDTTSYGDDIGQGMRAGVGLPGMLRAVNTAFDEAGVRDGWVRLMYAYPSNFSDEMIGALAELSILNEKRRGRVLPYIDIPLQHASDRILKLMRRNVTSGHQRELMHKLRERVPGMAIRTTFISGFPGETEADHQQLLEFIEDVGFDAVGVFEYSHEEGTVAGTMEHDSSLAVPADVKKRRRDEVMALQQELAFEQGAFLAEQFDEKSPTGTGVRLDVLIDQGMQSTGRETAGVGRGGKLYQGRTYFQAPQVDAVTYVQSSKPLSAGELVPCVIVGSDGYDLVAKPVDDIERKVGLNVLGAAGKGGGCP